MFEFTQHHGAVFLFVVKFQTFDEVLEGTHVLGVFDFGVDGVEFLQLDELLALLFDTAELLDHFQGGVEVKTAQAVAQIEHIHTGLTLEVIDVKGELGPWIGSRKENTKMNILLLVNKFYETKVTQSKSAAMLLTSKHQRQEH